MSFTKVAPAGIGTEPGTSILIGDSLLHSTGIDIGSNTGIGVTIRKHGDATFTGIITASAFFGDGSGLEGVSSSGIGTPLSDNDTSELNKIYYVNQELSIGSTVTVNHPDSAVASYTHYQDLVVKDDADFIVADGDTFIPDVLGIRTSTSTASAATGGRIRAGTITNAGANGAPNFPNGLTGTAGTFTTGTFSGAISAASGTITGNLGVGGVLTYEDVTNIDSIGIITARSTVSIADSIVHTGDTDTSLRFPSDNTIAAETGGSERLRIDSSGRVLINTTNNGNGHIAASNLAVQGADLSIFKDSGGDNAGVSGHKLKFVTQSGSLGEIDVLSEGGGGPSGRGGSMRFYTKINNTSSATEKLRIDSSGNVNIGVNASSNPFTYLRFGGSQYGAADIRPTDEGSHKVGLAFYVDGTADTTINPTERFRIHATGAVTKPQTPAFMAYGGSQSISAGNYIIFTQENYDTQGNYNTSNGIFTAPIAGRYLFTITGLYTNNSSTPPHKYVWHLNNVNQGVLAEWQDGSISNSYNTIGNSSIIYQLAVNDTIRIYVEAGNAHISGGQTRYCGYLLG